MTTPNPNQITFYDISMTTPGAPNPWKSRLALNFKKIPYKTTWVPLPNIAQVRASLNLPAGRKFADGSDFNTLPILEDRTKDSIIGDSFDIATYLHHTYPDSGAGTLFPPQTLDYAFTGAEALLIPLSERAESEFPEYARFNSNVDAVFTAHTQLMAYGLPFEPASAEETKTIFVKRAGVSSWENFQIVGEKREQLKVAFCSALADLARLFCREPSGPFILGRSASYADFIVGGWLHMMNATLPAEEWEEVKTWHGGTFGRLYDALEQYAEVK